MWGVVLSSPVIQSAVPIETPVTDSQPEEAVPVPESTIVDVQPPTPQPESENHVTEPPVSESNHVVKEAEPIDNNDVAKRPLLGVSSVSMGRSSRYYHGNTSINLA